MLFTTPQSGYNKGASAYLNRRSIIPGNGPYVMLDGTETLSEGQATVAIVRGPSASQSQAWMTFKATDMPADCTIDIQVSNTDVDGDYETIGTLTSPSASPPGTGYLTDNGDSLFYRGKVTAYSSGHPKLTIMR